MRHASPRRRRLPLPLLAAASLLAACQGAPPAGPAAQPYAYAIAGGTGRVALTPRFLQEQAAPAARRLQAVIATRTVNDIVHMKVEFVRVNLDQYGAEIGETAQGSIDLGAGELFNTVVVGALANDAKYRFKATAYGSAGETDPISDPNGSSVDLVTSNDDRPVAGELQVRLADKAFSGRATSTGLDVQEGAYSFPTAPQVLVTAELGAYGVVGGEQGGFEDGYGQDAELEEPCGMDVDADGNVYIADAGNHAIRRLAPDGELTTVAGDGGYSDTEGPVTGPRFHRPQDVAVAPDGKIYVADADNHKIRVIDDGQVTTFAAGLSFPRGVAVAPNGHIWVSDTGNNAVREFSATGTPLATYGGTQGYQDTADGPAQFDAPWGLVVGPDATVYVADGNNHAIRRIHPDGEVDTYAGDGTPGLINGNGEEIQAQFRNPSDLALDDDGTLYVADSFNHRIRKIEPGRIVRYFAGSSQGDADNFNPENARFDNPQGVAIDRVGEVYVGDTANYRIRRIQTKGRSPA